MPPLELHVYHDAEELAYGAADQIASGLAWAIQRNGVATIALSGGSTPTPTLEALARHPVAWRSVHLFQVDERIAPDGDDARNLTQLQTALLDVIDIPSANVHAIPVRDDLDAVTRDYEQTLREVCQGELDIVHLGLGDDGHTASLVPNDAVLGVDDRLVGATAPYMGHRRVTLTFPALAAARRIVWLVEGAGKAAMVQRLVAGDEAIPAGRVPQDRAIVCCDEAAVSSLLDGR